jgi:hypothetical protein
MHDLDICYPDREPGAVEIVAAADQHAMALSRTRRGRWQAEDLAGAWAVWVVPRRRSWSALEKQLPPFLAELERAGISELRRDDLLGAYPNETTELGLAGVLRVATEHPASIYVQVEEPAERTGGFPSDTGDELAAWITAFLSEPEQRDVLDKLSRSGAAERHAFVVLPAFATAPFAVFDMLTSEAPPVPAEMPELPGAGTDVWVMSVWDAGWVFRWFPPAAGPGSGRNNHSSLAARWRVRAGSGGAVPRSAASS